MTNFKLPTMLEEYRNKPIWVSVNVFKWDEQKKKYRQKVPMNPHNHNKASTTNPKTWGTYDEAVNHAEKNKYKAVGIMLGGESGLTGIDLDHALNEDGFLIDDAEKIVTMMNSYTEYGVSENGVHILFETDSTTRCSWGNKTTINPDDKGDDDAPSVEMYRPYTDEKGEIQDARYFVFTGNVYGEPKPIEEKTEAFKTIYSKYFRPKTLEDIVKSGTSEYQKFKNEDSCDCNHGYMLSAANSFVSRFGNTPEAKQAWLEDIEPKGCIAEYGTQEVNRTWDCAVEYMRGKLLEQAIQIPLKPEMYSDIGQAKVLLAAYPNKLRYAVGDNGKGIAFYCFDGVKWLIDDGFADEALQKLSEKQYDEAKKYDKDEAYKKFALRYQSNRSIMGVVRTLRVRVRTHLSDFDTNPYILNTPNGIIDLRTGQVRECNPEELCTRVTGCGISDTGKEIFDKYLNEITSNDDSLQLYLQNLLGMAALGKVPSPKMVIIYDPEGGCGKSTFLSLIAKVFGSYADNVPVDIYTNKLKDARKESAIMTLKGLRFAYGAEFDEGVKLSIQAVKNITSTDPITSKYMGCNYVTFKPSHTAFVSSNYLPQTSKGDNAIKDRMQILVFKNHFRDTPKDIKDYDEILFKECGGAILNWIVEGAVKFIENGLKIYAKIPQSVKDATDKYWEDNDWLKNFLDEYCESGEVDPIYGNTKSFTSTRLLYEWYLDYVTRVTPGYKRTEKEFGAEMERKGFRRRKSCGRMFYEGIALKADFKDRNPRTHQIDYCGYSGQPVDENKDNQYQTAFN